MMSDFNPRTGRAVLTLMAVAVALWLLSVGLTTATAEAPVTVYICTEIGPLNLRMDPRADAKVMYILPRGEPLQVAGDEVRGWVPVIYAGDPCWCWGEYLSVEPPEGVEHEVYP